MRRILPFLLLLIALQSSAQVTTSAVFDFNSPTKLSPSVQPSSSPGGLISVDRTVFKSGSISISCENHVGLATFVYSNITSYNLTIGREGKMTISAGAGEYITSVKFDGYIANMTLTRSQTGTWESVSEESVSASVSPL